MAVSEDVADERIQALSSAFPGLSTVEAGETDARRVRHRALDSAFAGIGEQGQCGGCGDCARCVPCDDDDDDGERRSDDRQWESVEPAGDEWDDEYSIETVARDPIDYLS